MTTEPTLEMRLKTLRAERETRVKARTGFLLMVGLATVVGLAAWTIQYYPLVKALIGGSIAILIFGLIMSPSQLDAEIQSISNEIDLLQTPEISIAVRAERLFRYHQFELKRYYDQALHHSTWIFLVGVLCIVAGFVFISLTAYFLIKISPANSVAEQIILASLGAGGGILANFVGVIYLRMFSETIKSLTEFHNRLVITHRLHFGNFLAAKIDDQQLREKTLAEMALNTFTQLEQIHSKNP
jgi:cobalamin biosynthesis protein CobD/CbiB